MNVSLEIITHDSFNSSSYEYTLLPFDVVLYIFNFLLGLPTHSYIIWLILSGTGRGIASEIFTLNVSVSEIMFCLRTGAAVITTRFPTFWGVMMFLSGFVINGRLFQCLICVERYLAVVHPVTFLKFKPLRYRAACCVFTWIMILVFCVFYLQLAHHQFNRVYKCLYVSQCSIFLSMNLFCCLAVLRALKQSGPGERGREREEENSRKRRAFHLILITTVTLIITYVPSLIVSVQVILSIDYPPEMNSVSRSCFTLAGFVQPLLYIRRVGKLSFCKTQ